MISKEAWYKETLPPHQENQLYQILQRWNIELIKTMYDDPCSIEALIPTKDLKTLKQNLSKIQRDLRSIGLRITFWKGALVELGSLSRISLHTIGPLEDHLGTYYHVTERRYLDSILRKGLIPHRNYELINNPRPAIYLAPDVGFLDDISGEFEDPVYLEVTLPPTHEVYPDCEFPIEEQVVYTTKRIPPENITVLDPR